MCNLLLTSSHSISFVSAPSSLSLALPLFLYLSVSKPYFSVDRAQEIIAWEGETSRSVTQTRCYKSTLFFERGVLPPWPRRCLGTSGLANKPTDTHSTVANTHQTQTQPLLAHLGGQDTLQKHSQHLLTPYMWLSSAARPTMGRSVCGDNTPSSNFIKWARNLETLIMCCWQKWCERYILPSLIE